MAIEAKSETEVFYYCPGLTGRDIGNSIHLLAGSSNAGTNLRTFEQASSPHFQTRRRDAEPDVSDDDEDYPNVFQSNSRQQRVAVFGDS